MTVQTRQSSTIQLLHSSYYLLHRIWLWWARLTYITQRAKNGRSSNDLTGLTAAAAAGWPRIFFSMAGRGSAVLLTVSSHFDTRVTPPKQELWLWRISTRDSSFHAKPILTRTKYLMYYQYGLQPNNKFTFIGFFQFIVYWQ